VCQESFDHPSELLGSLAWRQVPQRPEDSEDEASSKRPVEPLQLGKHEPAHHTGLHPLRRGTGEPRLYLQQPFIRAFGLDARFLAVTLQ